MKKIFSCFFLIFIMVSMFCVSYSMSSNKVSIINIFDKPSMIKQIKNGAMFNIIEEKERKTEYGEYLNKQDENIVKEKIVISNMTMLNVSARYFCSEFYYYLLVNFNSDETISITNTFDKDFKIKKIDNGFILCNNKDKKRLECIYDIESSSKTITLYGIVKDKYKNENNEYEVTINIVSSGVDKLYTHSKRWGVKENEKPKNLIKNIIIKFNETNKTINMPLTSYIDLANVDFIQIASEEHGKKIELEICGGQAGETDYRALYVFKNGFFERREVESGRFPNNNKLQLSLYSLYRY